MKTFSNPNDVAGTNVSGKHYLIHFADTVHCTVYSQERERESSIRVKYHLLI